MIPGRSTLVVSLLAVAFVELCGCVCVPTGSKAPNPIVGAWLVKDPNAPFPYHMYVFNADGTMQQANPDAGDPRGSDSDGKGMWIARGDRIVGKWVEVIADRVTHQFIGRLEITYDIAVSDDTYSGTETVRSYDSAGALTEAPPTPARFVGTRVTLR